MARALDDFIPTRRSLLTRLKNWDDQESWIEFFDTYGKLIYRVATQSGLNATEAQDVVQETIISVAKKMSGFKYDPEIGSFKGWLLSITRRRIADHLRKDYRQVPTVTTGAPNADTRGREEVADPATTDLDRIWQEEWQTNLLDAASRRVKRLVPAKQFQVFDFYVLKGMVATKVARELGVNLAQVYLAKHRVGRLLEEELRRLERRMM